MARWNFVVWALGTIVMSASVARPGFRGLPPEVIALMLRMTLPVAPKLSDMLVAVQTSGHWPHLFVTVMA